jgi:16S rRNA (cytidine1402-2'-O)-methyltransferase
MIAALSAAGIPADAFLFLGFLPAKSGQRRKRLTEFSRTQATLALFESPNRIAALLADAEAVLGADRRAALCRELTKLHETFDRGTLAELAERYRDAAVKGEIVLLVAPPDDAEHPSEEDIDAMLAEALRSASVKEAAQLVAETTGLSRRDLYQRALKLRGSR